MVTDSKITISGVGESDIGRTPDKNATNLYADACIAAIEDAHLEKNDIDGVLTGYSLVEPKLMHSTSLCDYLGFRPKYNVSLKVGGATPFVGVCHAASAIRQGQCENVLVAFGDNRKTGFENTDGTSALTEQVGNKQFENPFGPTIPSMYALIARKHMNRYETTVEDLAQVAVACRSHSSLRNEGQMTEPIDVEDVRSSPPIADPLRMLDCALVSDCAGAVVVSSEESAKETRAPVDLTGYGEGHGSEYLLRREDLLTSQAIQSGKTAFDMAGISPSDIDVAQLYDCFTITPLILMEDLGFCKKGEAHQLVREKGLKYNEEFPINTHGGELSYTGAGVFHIIEAVRQLRGEAEETQVTGAETVLAHGVGGVLSTHATLIMEDW